MKKEFYSSFIIFDEIHAHIIFLFFVFHIKYTMATLYFIHNPPANPKSAKSLLFIISKEIFAISISNIQRNLKPHIMYFLNHILIDIRYECIFLNFLFC
jgi:hypothetical protein